MKKKAARWAFGGFLLAVGLACVTINVYFPEAEIEDLSRVIEREVRKAAAEAQTPAPSAEPAPAQGDGGPAPGSASRRPASLLDALLGVTPAYAQSVPEAEVTNPAIRKIIDSRAQRLERVNHYKSLGAIGETNQALLETRNLGELADLKARAEVAQLVRDENKDREQLFREIAAAKGVDPSQIPRIRETYAGTLRDSARPGDWIQLPDGSWKQK